MFVASLLTNGFPRGAFLRSVRRVRVFNADRARHVEFNQEAV